MEHIPNYDSWKTTPPEEPEPKERCSHCGKPMWEGDALYTIDGGICEDCLADNYKSFV
jgi:formylmethanofuran dehydrogenase subunit E